MEYSRYDIINGTVEDLTQDRKRYTLSFIVLINWWYKYRIVPYSILDFQSYKVYKQNNIGRR
jgi:hypothetical protein